MNPLRLLVTAGPTREPIDAVRFLSNRSTGKMGFAVAAEAGQRGFDVRLIAGPVAVPTPAGVEQIDVTTARDMCEAVETHFDWCDVLIMAAAVADWRPAVVYPRKMKKRDGAPDLVLERTADILDTLRPRKGGQFIVGFAAESDDVVAEASRKRDAKDLDLIVANDIMEADAGFESESNRVVLIPRDGPVETLPLMSKRDVARHILDRLEHAVRTA